MKVELGMDCSGWRAAAMADPTEAARSISRLIDCAFCDDQRTACLAWRPALKELEENFQSVIGSDMPLAGIPYFLKDLFHLKGSPTGAGSHFLASLRGTEPRDGSFASHLRKLGAVCVGKTQMHEFAYGVTGQNQHFGDCDNPCLPGHTTGGSSSGSAAVVAAGIVPFSVGSDTGGSIRVPAAFCGLFGYRHVPDHPWINDVIPLARDCDSAGWFARTAKDLKFVTQAILGNYRMAEKRQPRGCFLCTDLSEPAFLDEYRSTACGFSEEADSLVSDQLRHAFRDCEKTYSVITSTQAAEFHQPWLESRKAEYGPAVWSRIDRGRHWSVEALSHAQIRRHLLRDTLKSYFLTFDFLILPAVPCPALRHEDCDTYDRRRIIELGAPASLAGLPTLSIPWLKDGKPSGGLQVILPSPNSPTLDWFLCRCGA